MLIICVENFDDDDDDDEWIYLRDFHFYNSKCEEKHE